MGLEEWILRIPPDLIHPTVEKHLSQYVNGFVDVGYDVSETADGWFPTSGSMVGTTYLGPLFGPLLGAVTIHG